jgi:hypothetical protein
LILANFGTEIGQYQAISNRKHLDTLCITAN